MDSQGNLNEESAARIDYAAAYESERQSYLIVLCGWAYREDSKLAIADAMYAYLKLNHPSLASRTVCQRLSRDTVGDALFSRMYLDSALVETGYSVHVFTSDYHVKRTTEIFNFFFRGASEVSVFGAPGFTSPQACRKELDSLLAFRETFKDIPAGDVHRALATLCEKHPFYNGKSYTTPAEIARINHNLA
jgi:hypothetical protein